MCNIVKTPANVSWDVRKHATDVAYKAILLNEVASRPYNSGHHTIESCYTSQFEQHLRAVGLPLGEPSMKTPAAGEPGFILAHQLIRRALSIPGVTVHWYDKLEMRKQQKMGHVTIVGPSMGDVEERLKSIIKEEGSDCQATVTPHVGITMGSNSDLPVMKDAARILNMFGMLAALTPLPVISVTVHASALDVLDSLLSIVQMPRGVPVATVAINNAANAGLLAVRMMGIRDADLLARMSRYQEDTRNDVLRKAEKLEKDGWESYLNP
ncbi:hypothetical protein SO802_021524 [Lithocarpus litseifolius]|uniref:phosphoribosylaminoimidazole carboxylase n=1 Tax=Lithocarpus litseifolius TaxID=425828 RepID=A0AAW2CGJ4_9ROSI